MDQAQQVGALHSERSSRVGAVAAVLAERRLDQLALEGGDGRAVGRGVQPAAPASCDVTPALTGAYKFLYAKP